MTSLMNPLLQINSNQVEDILIDSQLIPIGAIKGDLILIRSKLCLDKLLLYKVENILTSVTKQPLAQPQQQRRIGSISLSSQYATNFNWIKPHRNTQVELDLVLAPPPPNLTASYIEVHFSNVYLSRPDMLRLTLEMNTRTTYHGQRLTLSGSGIRLQVGGIFNQEGKRIQSAYVDGATRVAFRSSSARAYVFIEISEEMSHFEDDGSILREKCAVFLEELLKNWKGGGKGKADGVRRGHATNHTISIILYGRVIYEDNGEGEEDRAPLKRSDEGVLYRDFYKVLVDLTPALPGAFAQTVAIEIRNWQHHVLLRKRASGEEKRAGRIAFAHESNILEATNLAVNLFEEHWIDRDLQRTGIALIVLTAGTTMYHVPKDLLRLTTERLLFHGIGMDLISLSPTPLHTVPLFSFRSQDPSLAETTLTLPDDQRSPLYFDPQYPSQETSIFYYQPNFIFVSFFGFQIDKPYRIDRFMPRARCYELFSQGVGEQTPIAIAFLPSHAEMEESSWTYMSEEEKKRARRDRYDALAVGAKVGLDDLYSWNLQSGTTHSGTSASIDRSGSETSVYRVPTLSHRLRDREMTPRSATSSLPPVIIDVERGRERRMSDAARIPSSTRSRTPIGRPRAPSITPSVNTIHTATRASPATTKSSATPALISRLTSQAAIVAPPTASDKPRASWLGLFRGAVHKPVSVGATPSIAVQRVAARANSTLELDTNIPLLSQSPSSIISPGGISLSRRSSTTATTRPTQPILIGSKVIPETADIIPAHPASLMSIAKFAPVEEAVHHKSYKRKSFESRLNPSKSGRRSAGLADQERRWSSIFIRHSNDQRSVNWTSICTPACLPITTDYLPPTEALASQYTDYRYSIPTDCLTSSLLLHGDGTRQSLALELIQELISQRLSHGFQVCTFGTGFSGNEHEDTSKPIAEILEDIDDGEPTPIYLSLANQIHRLVYDRRSQSVVVKILKKRRTWVKRSFEYSSLIWTNGDNFDQTTFEFPYPNLIEPHDWEHLDRLVGGVELPDLRPSLRYWRTRLVLLPAEGIPDREFLIGNSKGIDGRSTNQEINLVGFNVLMELLQASRWTANGVAQHSTTTEITHLNPGDWALSVAERSIPTPVLQERPSRVLRRPAVASIREERERTSSPSRPSVRQPSRHRHQNLSPDRKRSDPRPTVPEEVELPVVEMSYSIILDLDPQRKSPRAERVIAHFDRSHNPTAAYHVELMWLAGSGKVIESSIASWSRQVARYGLNLIEVSTRGVDSNHNPFQKARQVELALAAPRIDSMSGLTEDHYEHRLLEHLGFFLDIGADSTFPPSIIAAYSYRRTNSTHSQYIHRSGTALVTIISIEDKTSSTSSSSGGERQKKKAFAFVPNRIYISHVSSANLKKLPEQILERLLRVCEDRDELAKLWKTFEPSTATTTTASVTDVL